MFTEQSNLIKRVGEIKCKVKTYWNEVVPRPRLILNSDRSRAFLLLLRCHASVPVVSDQNSNWFFIGFEIWEEEKCYLSTLTSQQMTTSSSCPSVSLKLTIWKRKVWRIFPGLDGHLMFSQELPCPHCWWRPHWACSSLASPPCLQKTHDFFLRKIVWLLSWSLNEWTTHWKVCRQRSQFSLRCIGLTRSH